MTDDLMFPRDPSEAEWEVDTLDFLSAWWEHIDGSELIPPRHTSAAPDLKAGRWKWTDLVLYRRLHDAVKRINPQLPSNAIKEVVEEFAKRESSDPYHERHRLHVLITGGVKVIYDDPESGQTRTDVAWVLDFLDPHANEFVVANQVAVKSDRHSRRLDLVAYVNGLPLAVFELKAAKAQDGAREAYDQLMTYSREFGAGALAVPALAIATDGITARMGSLLTQWEYMAPWNVDLNGRPVNPTDGSALETLVAGVFNPTTFLDLMANYVSFSRERGGGIDTVRVAKAHQVFAVNKAIDKTITAVASDGKIGVVWHTQGSGKSMEMVYYVAKAMKEPALRNPTFVILTDRLDLDGQLYATFAASDLTPERTLPRAENKEQIQRLLADRPSGGIIFTTLQKFWRTKEDRMNNVYFPTLSTRRNIVVIVDEAHRSQYENVEGYARNLHDALPNAAFIAFTGTPVSFLRANTRTVFGDYIDVYDLSRAVRDGATVRVFYENRHIPVHLPEDREPIEFDEEADLLTSDLEPEEQEEVRKVFALYEDVVGAPERVAKLSSDIVEHWLTRRDAMFSLTGKYGKGMIVCYSRKIASMMYDALIERLRERGEDDWHSDSDAEGRIKVVYTSRAKDSALINEHNRPKSAIQEIQRRATDDKDPLELVIVQSMWLTGFDSPPLHTLYLDKTMKGASLMQAIARVNRRWGEKPSGLVVDYLGITESLTKALAEYTTDTDVDPGQSIGETVEAAEDLVIEICGVLNDQLSGIEWRRTRDSGRKRAFLQAALDVIEYLRQPEPELLDGEPNLAQRFADSARKLAQAFSNCSRSLRLRPLRPDIEFYNAVRQYQAKLRAEERAEKGLASRADVELAIRQLTARAVAVDDVVDIYEAAGIERPDLSHLDSEFLQRIRESRRPNLAIEALRRAIAREIRAAHPHNVVRQETFTDKLLKTMERYRLSGLTAAEIMEALVRLAKEISADRGRAEELGLNEDQLAFYDAVAQNDSAKELLGDVVLAEIAKALVKELKDLPRDWHIREQAQALVRSKVKRLLAMFGYPPDGQQGAVDLVLRQTRTYVEEHDAPRTN